VRRSFEEMPRAVPCRGRRALAWRGLASLAFFSGLALLATLELRGAPAPAASFVVPDSTSRLYRSFVAVAGDDLGADENSRFTGDLHSNRDIELDKKSSVTGNVSAAGDIKEHGTVTGTLTSHAAPRTLPTFPTDAAARALANRVLSRDTTFKNAVVDDVVFVAGDVTIHGSLNGRGTIIAKGKLHLEQAERDGGGDQQSRATLAPTTKLSLLSFQDIKIGQSRQFRGLLYAQGRVEVGEKASLQGVVIAGRKLQVGQDAQLVFLELDDTPPVISQLTPQPGSLLATATPTISAAFADDLSGVDPSTIRLTLDGTDQTAKAAVTAAALTFIPAAPLPDGSHAVALDVRDAAGNPAHQAWSFTTDITPPSLVITSPATATVGTVTPTLGFAYTDATSGVDPTSLRVLLDGTDVTATCQRGPGSAACTPPPLRAGPHGLAASVRDRAGNAASASLSFQIVLQPPSVAIIAPADLSYVATAQPPAQGTYSSAAGIDPGSVNLKLDFVDVTAAAQVGATSLTFTPGVPLTEGSHLLQLMVKDTAGGVAFAASQFFVDLTPPTLAVTAPTGAVVATKLRPEIALRYADSGSGIDLATLQVAVDGSVHPACNAGSDTADCRLADDLPAGAHTITASIRDVAGNRQTASASFNLTLDVPPRVTIASPATGTFVSSASTQVAGTATSPAGVMRVDINGVPATLAAGGQFTATVALQQGANLLRAIALDAAGLSGSADVVVNLNSVPPVLTLTSPTPGEVVNTAAVAVAGRVASADPAVAVAVNGQPTAVTNGSFSLSVPLAEGPNAIQVTATDRAGNTAQAAATVTRFSLPSVAITSPADLSYLASTTVNVQGTVSDAATVSVNGVQAQLRGTSFEAHGVPLIEGGNTLTATATTPGGSVGTATINVVRDLTPPRLSIDSPRDGSAVFDSTLTVSGLVNDIVAGTVNAAQAKVTVNGLPATVANRSFVVDGMPLALGTNTLTAIAVDASGNTGRASITVRRVSPAGLARIRVASGDRQQGVIGSTLPAPLAVQLLDATGSPAPGRAVGFQLRGNNGSLGSSGRIAVVTTDATGQAAVSFTLGTRAGAATQVVTATATGFAGPAVFTETANPGPPALLVVDSGDEQVGVAGQQLPRPLVAVVTDSGFNRLGGVAVDLKVVKGQGHFLNGLGTLTTTTDSDGRVIVPFVLDPAEGVANNAVQAVVSGQAVPVAGFVATGRAAGPAAPTSISGVVLDNAGAPIQGVTLRILNSILVAQTDAQGLFRIAGSPVGDVTLIVDGSTANRPGAWPDLEYKLVTVSGRDNSPNMPIYLLPLDQAQGLQVDETHGGTLTLSQMPGFALEIAPGSVTFPGGGRSGFVSVTVVHNDKVPMVPNFGQQPRLIVTIQPAGARFDPPARLTLPNVEGLPPGQVTEMYSFDHDLGHFVSIGPATVSDDGSVIRANPGVGVIKAGWHCGGNPFVQATLDECPVCHKCEDGGCQPQTGSSCDDGDPCTINDICINGTCVGAPLEPGTVTVFANGKPIKVAVAIGSGVQFSAKPSLPNCPSPAYKWDFGDGATSTDPAPSHLYPQKGVYNVTLQLTCPPCPRVLATGSVAVYVVALDKLTVSDGATQSHFTGQKNWGTVRKPGKVTLLAQISPETDGAADLIVWTGATPDPSDNHKATVPRATPAHTSVKAEVGTTSDTAEIWVMLATLMLKTGGQLDGNDHVELPLRLSFPNLGAMTDEKDYASGFTVGEAAGQVEMVGTLSPSGLGQVLTKGDSGWKFSQRLASGGCKDGGVFAPQNNANDDPTDNHQQTDPDASDHIFFIDAPTIGLAFQIQHNEEIYDQFGAQATWNGDPASQPLFWYFWGRVNADLPGGHVDPQKAGTDIELLLLSEGRQAFPSACVYPPKP
jgi:hypothetical protein